MTATATASVRADARLGFGGVLRSEWIKFTSLRSTYWTSGVILLVWIGFALLMAGFSEFSVQGVGEDELRQYLAVIPATIGVNVGVLVAGILGVLAFSGEYSTGMVRSSLTAVPSRLPVLAAKAVVVFVWSFLLGALSVTLSFLAAQPFFAADGLAGAPDGPVLLAFLGAAVYLGLIALFGLGIGALVRAGAGGIAIVVGLIMVLPIVGGILSGWIDWVTEVLAVLPSQVGMNLTGVEGNALFGDPAYGMGASLLILAAWSAASLLLGALALKGRDA
ncbi:ABC transporter permease [Arenivirga flava]|uniref:ABC transporter permease n=1 Tax=Arenivirga flava TaxID=1930060 RepID=A0AA37X835_9MICO|nr:ABC transporter permease [Arenivirga flava]GMA27089.1 ABC transporter permease [Arenivirga flava]